MKDYSMSEEERENFVLGFVESDGTLYVKFAGEKETWPLPLTEENRQIILSKMRKQVKKAGKFERDKTLNKLLCGFLTIVLAIATIVVLINLKNFSDINIALLSLSGVGSFASLIGYIRANAKLKDLEKNKHFLEMEEELNSNIRNNNTLANVSDRTKQMVMGMPEDRPVFDINSFNNVPFSDLEKMKANIDRNKRFGFVYDENDPHERAVSESRSSDMTRRRQR